MRMTQTVLLLADPVAAAPVDELQSAVATRVHAGEAAVSAAHRLQKLRAVQRGGAGRLDPVGAALGNLSSCWCCYGEVWPRAAGGNVEDTACLQWH